jgi:hypothetical protein
MLIELTPMPSARQTEGQRAGRGGAGSKGAAPGWLAVMVTLHRDRGRNDKMFIEMLTCMWIYF